VLPLARTGVVVSRQGWDIERLCGCGQAFRLDFFAAAAAVSGLNFGAAARHMWCRRWVNTCIRVGVSGTWWGSV